MSAMNVPDPHPHHTVAALADRRQSSRIHGPFEGVRVGILDLPVSIYDLSAGGCFVNAKHDQHPGVEFDLRIQLPGEGWLRLEAKTLYPRPGYGYAVRFVGADAETKARLEAAVERLSDEPLGVR
jgi:hypothetical protein